MSPRIFISHSSKDRAVAQTICQALETRGLSCWIASRDVHGGENFQEAIVRALRQARVMLLVFSSNANNSDEIKKELVLAGQNRVTVVPVRVEDVAPNDAFTYELATRQWVDLFQDWERQIALLAARLSQLLGEDGERPGAAPPGAVPRRSGSAVAGAALVLLVLMAGGLFYLKSAYLEPFYRKSLASPAPATPSAQTGALIPTPRPAPVRSAATPPPVIVAAPQAQAEPQGVSVPPNPAITKPRNSTRSSGTAVADAAPAALSSAPPSAAAPDPESAAWDSAQRANRADAMEAYLIAYPAGAHLQEAQLALANAILAAPATGAAFDGSWQTTWTCPNLGQYPGYSYRYAGSVKNGVFHGTRGDKGEPSSMALDGRIDADGEAAFFGDVVVGSTLAGLGAARGTHSEFHALAHFSGDSGTGKRIEGRGCSLSFARG